MEEGEQVNLRGSSPPGRRSRLDLQDHIAGLKFKPSGFTRTVAGGVSVMTEAYDFEYDCGESKAKILWLR